MSAILTESDAVRLAEREANAADLKSGLFYPYYSGLTGKIAKIYPDGTAAVTIDAESMPSEIRTRHTKGTDAMRQKWLDGLSDEARNKLSSGEKKFALRYTLLVGVGDLSPMEAALEAPAEPNRKSLAEIEVDEAKHLAEVALKRKD
jgi:hypothetical protein